MTSTTYKDYWAYKEVSKNWKSKVSKTQVTIYFDDKCKEVYGQFTLKGDKESDMYLIYCNGELINDELEFYDSWDDAVKSCFYYFHTRF